MSAAPTSPQSAMRKPKDEPTPLPIDPDAPQKIAILSTYDKTGLLDLAKNLAKRKVKLYGSGGTAAMVREAGFPISDVSEITKAPEILGGRVKTLHPSVHGGILARDIDSDQKDLDALGILKVDYVVCNLYPFKETVAKPFVKIDEAVEEIDIGGVTLLRAAAKNHTRVTVLCDPKDYPTFLEEFRKGDISQETRNMFALKAFLQTADYDLAISDFFRKKYAPGIKQLTLRYGVNPHQIPAQAYVREDDLPFKVLNGAPGYINLLDALYSWPLVKELTLALNLPAAASFKHVSPAGAAVGIPLSPVEKKVYFAEDIDDKSALAAAYARARGADRMSSFGDWIALSDTVDVATAKLISREVSDGIVAPEYEPAALEILKKKKGGKYTILQIDSGYVPSPVEIRQVYGVTLQQQRNDAKIDASTFRNIVSSDKSELSEQALTDLIVATIALKYTQSNSVCYAKGGMVVGLGAGQQSRIHCTRLAGDKTDNWWLRHHPKVLGMQFAPSTKRPDKANAIDLYVSGQIPETNVEKEQYEAIFKTVPEPLTAHERAEFLKQLDGVAASSDAFFPFPDNIHRLARSGVRYVSAPGGSVQDSIIHDTADSYGMVYMDTGLRLFTH